MAKKQTFESKLTKSARTEFRVVKMEFSYQSPKTGAWKFAKKLVKVPLDADEQKYLDQEMKSGLAYMEKH